MWLKRIRNSIGFGVHSPFAYLLTRMVIHPGKGYSYYGYAKIERACNIATPNSIRRRARMLLRLLAFISNTTSESKKKSIFLPSHAHPAFRAAILAAMPHIRIESRPDKAAVCDIIAAPASLLPQSVLTQVLSRPGSILLLSSVPPRFPSLPEATLTLLGKHNAILFNRPQMQPLTYHMSI